MYLLPATQVSRKINTITSFVAGWLFTIKTVQAGIVAVFKAKPLFLVEFGKMFMEPIHLFAIATRQAEWLAVRQKMVAGNIANVNTPGYQARDVEPFSSLLSRQPLVMVRTSAGHMDIAGSQLESAAIQPEKAAETTHSGNNVLIEEELRKGGEISREMSLNTAIVKSFHRMMMATVKGG